MAALAFGLRTVCRVGFDLTKDFMSEEELMSIVGRRVKRHRVACGLSLSQLAKNCGVNKSNICRYEAGAQFPGMKTLLAMANVLSITPSKLLEPWENIATSEKR